LNLYLYFSTVPKPTTAKITFKNDALLPADHHAATHRILCRCARFRQGMDAIQACWPRSGINGGGFPIKLAAFTSSALLSNDV
jgi:hypothetical protein